MCGIIGYVGKKNALPVVVDGLKRLEYRGYDSAGVALWDGSKFVLAKSAGRVSVLESLVSNKALAGSVAIAHTRWATHGRPSDANSHPHSDCKNSVHLVHNGIVENYTEIKDALLREGHMFRSDTDTEVLAHLVERQFSIGVGNTVLEDALRGALTHVKGTFGLAVVAMRDPKKIVVAKRGSPIILGIGAGEYLVASDAAALVEHTQDVIYLNDNEMAVLAPESLRIMNISGKNIEKPIDKINWDIAAAQKAGFKHFMKKEIFEGPEALKNVLKGRTTEDGVIKLENMEKPDRRIKNIKRILITACGTSYYSGLVGKYYFEEFAKLPVSVEYASEFRYGNQPLSAEDAVILISQSGETADTLEAMKEVKKRGALSLSIVNVVGSAIARNSNAAIYNYAGPEIGVASTKAFISQLGALLLSALYFAEGQGTMPKEEAKKIFKELAIMPAKMEEILKKDDEIRKLAEKYLKYKNFLYLGRHYQFPVALEGALKLKEISYRHAEGYASGEMKHGPIALIDRNFPVVAVVPKASPIGLRPRDALYEKMISNIEEVKARSGKVLAIATEGDEKIKRIADDVIYISEAPDMLTPLLSVIPLQLFAYHTADLLGLDVDKPRNLAKSVTVE